VTAVAAALMLHGVVTLSERRGAFVSAVTHELRTPLTTFRMYAEMLAEGMVQDEQQTKLYLQTLSLGPSRAQKHMLISRCQVLAKRLGRLVSLDRPSVYNGLSRPTPLSRPTSRRTDCPVASSMDNVTLCAGRT
jgi:signal transduction histidine kinase